MSKKINIIGAGIAGLCAGSYLQMNGYETEIFEMHNLPGGLCTTWERKGFHFDGCIHWLVGSSPSDDFFYLWNELIDMKQLTFIDHKEYMRIEGENGQFISISTNIDEFEKELLAKAPEDKELIVSFISGARKLMNMKLPVDKATEVATGWDKMKMMFKLMPYLGTLKKWSSISAKDFAAKCKNPLLQKTIIHMFAPEMSVLFLLMTMVWMHKKSAGYPIGGSLNFARLIEKRYIELGGKIRYNSRVKKILTTNNSASGVLLENGETCSSDIVISAADGHASIYEMLDGQYTDETINGYYDNYRIFPSLLQVSVGVSRTFPEDSHVVVFSPEPPLQIDPKMQLKDISFHIYNYDSTLAPEGKTVITTILPTFNYTYWTELREKDKEKYKAEKDRVGNAVVDLMEEKLGNIRTNLDVLDVSTPATLIRYTGNWKGSFEGWQLTPEVSLKTMKKVLPGLENFYMAGQWVEPGGGLPACIISGRGAAQVICKKDKKKFTTVHY
jgi:phytoene dehydrogenase-like protein